MGNVTLDEPDPLQVYIAPFGRCAREKRRETQDTPSTCELFIKVERRQRVDKVAAAAYCPMAIWPTTNKTIVFTHFPNGSSWPKGEWNQLQVGNLLFSHEHSTCGAMRQDNGAGPTGLRCSIILQSRNCSEG